MADMLQIVGECAYVTQDTTVGKAKVLLMKGAVFSSDAPEAGHLLSTGLAARVGGDATPGLDATGEPVLDPDAAGTGTPAAEQTDGDDAAKAEAEAAEAEAKRAAARAKLPEDGSAPAGNASTDVWIEYAVREGYDRAEVEKSSRDDIKKLFQS